MASAVIFGLALATVLTLVVVPTLYALIHTSSLGMASATKWIQKAYWKPFYRIMGIPEENGE